MLFGPSAVGRCFERLLHQQAVMAKKSSTSKASGRRSSAKRDRVNTGSDLRFVKRTSTGRFKESDDAGRAQKADRPRRAKTAVKSGYGDQGDRRKKR